MRRIGTWTLWLSLFILLLPFLLFAVGILIQTCCWDPKTVPPSYLEMLHWSPILMFVTTPIAVVGGIAGLVMRIMGKRKQEAG